MGTLSEADRFLLEGIRQGRADAWTQLVDRYKGPLLRYARRSLQRSANAADEEDVVQETFVSFLKAVPNFRADASIQTYLFTILRNKINDTFRGRKASVCLLQDVMSGTHDAEDASPTPANLPAAEPTASFYARRDEEHGLQYDLLLGALREIVDPYKQSLRFQDLQVVELIFYCQLPNKQTAEILSIPENKVAVTKHRVLKRIQEVITRDRPSLSFDPPDALLSQIWQEQRLSCPKPSTIGAYHQGILEPDWQDYVAFHVDRLGCHFCQAILEEMQRQDATDRDRAVRDRILQSTIGFLSRR